MNAHICENKSTDRFICIRMQPHKELLWCAQLILVVGN